MIFPDQLDLFFDWLLRASWEATLLIGLIFFIVFLFRRQFSPRARYVFWLLVVIRLLPPLVPESRFNPFNLIDEKTWSVISTVPVASVTPQPVKEKALSVRPAGWMASIDWKRDFFFVWLTGVAVLGLRLVFRTWLLGFRISRFRPVIDSPVLELLEECKEALGVRTPLFLVETPHVRSVALMGFIRPRLLLPRGIFNCLNREELRHVFLHEIGHVKRWDIATNWIMHLVQILHWFNPAVWIAFARARADRELACDALVLAQAEADHEREYGHTILKLLQNFSASSPMALPAVVGVLEYKNQITERISMISQFTKKSYQWSVAAVMTAAILALFACTKAPSLPSKLIITKAYWEADSPDQIGGFTRRFLGENHFYTDGSPLINVHVTCNESDNGKYGWKEVQRFMSQAGQGFKLKAAGSQDIPVQIRTGAECGNNMPEELFEVMMTISPQNYQAMVAGTPYSLVPDNPNPDYQWEVADGVTLVKH